MSWFAASLLYERTIDAVTEAEAPALFEEKIILVRADDETTARMRAEARAAEGSVAYLNQFNEEIEWRVVAVIDVKELFDETLDDGSEVFYRFLNRAEADMLRQAVNTPLGG